MKRVVIAIPMSHGWLWPQTCISALKRYPPSANDCECKIVVVNNAADWSDSSRGITDTRLGDGIEVIDNPSPYPGKCHGAALDTVIKGYEFDYLFALETDTVVLRHGWLAWFMDQLEPDSFAAGHWHIEQFINPACTLYRGEALRAMLDWSQQNMSATLRWGPNFENTAECTDCHPENLRGPFNERRGWPRGTVFRETPTGQMKGPGHYEPGQALYHWARSDGWDYRAVPTATAFKALHWPYQTLYGEDQPFSREYELGELANAGTAYACHFWLGTGGLNILKHPITAHDRRYMEYGLAREARFWLQGVDADVREQTIALIRKHGWHTASIRGDAGAVTTDTYENLPLESLRGPPTAADLAAAAEVEAIYRANGVAL